MTRHPTPPSQNASYGELTNAMRRGKVLAKACPSRQILKHVTSQWGVLVLLVLMKGTHRFSELRRKIEGVSEKMLAQTLQQLEEDGLVARYAHPVVPPHVEYSLTSPGKELGQHIEALTDWIEHNLPTLLAARRKPD
ncbi:MAG: helix-turn-helix domain-containing protein [Halomonas sp.]|nr:helix-turn-helix domain-containing protein [Halomonas sp.]MDM7481754.1 helix-turn-helix domain-containing protein [Halomonas sp.]